MRAPPRETQTMKIHSQLRQDSVLKARGPLKAESVVYQGSFVGMMTLVSLWLGSFALEHSHERGCGPRPHGAPSLDISPFIQLTEANLSVT